MTVQFIGLLMRTYIVRSLALVIVGLLALLPASAWSQDTETDQPCAACHSEQHDAWIASAHGTVPPESVGAIGGASCVDCHGPYIKDHPAAGTVRLTVDSSLCQDCYSGTYDEWQHTQRASEGVQCISCHRPHSQELRLTDQALCQSCHRDTLIDSLHAAHRVGEVACTSCHMATHDTTPANGFVRNGLAAASHDFIVVTSQNCLDCHRNDVATTKDPNRLVADVSIFSAELTAAQRTNKILTALSATNLGLGIGFGGILGIVFMLVAARVFPRRDS